MNTRDNCCCFTGHRCVASAHIEKINTALSEIIARLCGEGVTDFITGGALGFDTLSALAVLGAKRLNPEIRLVLALPCKGQDSRWHKSDREMYAKILNSADEIIYVSENYSDGCMLKRNRFMVEHSRHCVFYMSSTRGGTAYTVKYALQNELEVHNVMV